MLIRVEGGLLSWHCVIFDEDGDLVSCGKRSACQVDQAQYREAPLTESLGKGAVMALPRCTCGAQMFLKADYSLKELWKNTLTVKNEQGVVWAYVLTLAHARNLWAHWLLYERGLAPIAPLLSLPPPHTMIGNLEMTHSLWFGFAVARAHLTAIGAVRELELLKGGQPWPSYNSC
jgi:hypothetical protein